MPFISVGKNMDEIPEEEAVPEGEYDLEVVNVNDPKESDKGRTVITCAIRVCDPDYPNARLVSHSLVFPNQEDWEHNEQTANMLMRNCKRFLHAFGVEWTSDGFDTDDLLHAQARCALGMDEYQGEVANKLRLPRISE